MRRLGLTLILTVLASSCAGPAGEIDVVRSIGDREYRLFVPADVADPAPLVLLFHGFAGSPAEVRDLSGFDDVARSGRFAVAYPRAAGLIPAWRTDPFLADPDVTFARDVVGDVAAVIPVDPDRVYAAGMSNGGGMAGRLACDAADVFAAVGMVAAAHAPGSCNPARPVPIVAFHGDADLIVPLEGREPLLLAPGTWLDNRADGYSCGEVTSIEVADDVTRYQAAGCAADIAFYVVAGGRHGWPGSDRATSGGGSTTSIDASVVMWEFFASHPILESSP